MKKYRHREVIQAIQLTPETRSQILSFQNVKIWKIEPDKYDKKEENVVIYRKGFGSTEDHEFAPNHPGRMVIRMGEWIIINSRGIWAKSNDEFREEFVEC